MPAVKKTERLEARVPIDLKKVIQHAADLQGRSLTDFVIASLDKAAREALREYEIMTLNTEDSLRVARLLLDAPKPNAALKQAAERHRKSVTIK